MAVKKEKIPLIEQDAILLSLRRLNMIVPNELPILSLYATTDGDRIRTKKTLEYLDKKMDSVCKQVKKQGLNPKVIRKDYERIKEFIEFSTIDGPLGLAAFVSGYRDLFLTYPINFKFRNEVILANKIYKAPLIRLLSEQPHEVFLVLQPNKSIIYYFTDGKLEEKEPPIFPKNNEPLREYMRRVKDEYWPYFRSHDVKSVFMLGSKEAMENFVGVLAKSALQKIREKIEVSRQAPRKKLDKLAEELIQKYNIIIPKEKVEHAKNLSQRRMAAFGPAAVLKAIREGKVKELLIDPSFKSKGYRCKRCGLLGLKLEEQCPFCKNEIQKVKHIKSAIKRDAKLFGFQITKVSHPYLKKEGDGIAAILRFS
jgi:rubrerythrin